MHYLCGAVTQRVVPLPAQTCPSYRKYDAGRSPLRVTLTTRRTQPPRLLHGIDPATPAVSAHRSGHSTTIDPHHRSGHSTTDP